MQAGYRRLFSVSAITLSPNCIQNVCYFWFALSTFRLALSRLFDVALGQKALAAEVVLGQVLLRAMLQQLLIVVLPICSTSLALLRQPPLLPPFLLPIQCPLQSADGRSWQQSEKASEFTCPVEAWSS